MDLVRKLSNMNILLVSPLAKQPIKYPYTGLAYLATYIRDLVDDVDIFIPGNEDNEDTFVTRLQKSRPDVVGISIFTLAFSAARKTAKLIKNFDKDIIVIGGGPHPSGDPAGTLKSIEEIDFVFKGEAEIGLREFVRLFKEGKVPGDHDQLSRIPGLVWRQESSIISNDATFVQDLESIGFPAYDLMPPDQFIGSTGSGFMKSKHIGFICASRGCPRQCTFCAGHVVNGRRHRKRDPQQVVEEMKLLYGKYAVREIQFTDPDMSLDRVYLKTICEMMIDERVKLHWSCGAHATSIDEDLLRLMKKSGCYMVRVGVEAGSERISKLIKKGIDFEQIEKVTKSIRRNGIHTHGFFMLGLPTETLEEMKETIELSRELDLDSASFSIFQPLPGSEIYEQHVKSNPQYQLNWDNFDFFRDAGFRYALPFNDMKKLQRKAYLGFYIRRKMVFRTAMKFLGVAKLATLIKMSKRNLG